MLTRKFNQLGRINFTNFMKFQSKGFKINTPEVYFNNFDASLSKNEIDMCKLTPIVEAGK